MLQISFGLETKEFMEATRTCWIAVQFNVQPILLNSLEALSELISGEQKALVLNKHAKTKASM